MYLDMGDQVAVEALAPKGDEQGVAGRHFQKLILYVHFALTGAMIGALKRRFPSWFFQTVDHFNHDHPISHVVTMVGTRMLQRMIAAGSAVLDVYGNPRAATQFNYGQRKSKRPKAMSCMYNAFCDADFIRAANKWGPKGQQDPLGARFMGTVLGTPEALLEEFDVFQLIHTLYYVKPHEIFHLLGSGKRVYNPDNKRVTPKCLALVHRHNGRHGWLNDKEQEFWVQGGIVKQRNIATNTVYYHPQISDFWFAETKSWYNGSGLGFTWECHFVCEDTWIIEICPANRNLFVDDSQDKWAKLFDQASEATLAVSEPPADERPVVRLYAPSPIPGEPEIRVNLEVTNLELFGALRRHAAGKPRVGNEGKKLYDSLLATAKHLSAPGALFPEMTPVSCPPHLLFDHVMSAFVTDVERESGVLEAVKTMRAVLIDHSESVRHGATSESSFHNLLAAARTSLRGASVISTLFPKPVGLITNKLDSAFA